MPGGCFQVTTAKRAGRFDIRHRDPRALSSGRLSIQVFVLERTNQYLLENPRCGMFV